MELGALQLICQVHYRGKKRLQRTPTLPKSHEEAQQKSTASLSALPSIQHHGGSLSCSCWRERTQQVRGLRATAAPAASACPRRVALSWGRTGFPRSELGALGWQMLFPIWAFQSAVPNPLNTHVLLCPGSYPPRLLYNSIFGEGTTCLASAGSGGVLLPISATKPRLFWSANIIQPDPWAVLSNPESTLKHSNATDTTFNRVPGGSVWG